MPTFIVTGTSRGLGQAIAEQIVQKSKENKVVLVARSQKHDDFVRLFPEADQANTRERTLAIAGDLTDAKVVAKVVKEALSKFGSIDSVILNAGMLDPVGHVADISVDSVRRLFEINFFSVIELAKQTIPHLRKSESKAGASMLFVSSGASTKSYDGWMAYGSSKACINHLCLDIHSEESPLIRTISVAPGVVDTDMQVDIRTKSGKNMKPEALKRFLDLHEKGQLEPPAVPGSVYANLAVRGIPDELSGQYVRYNDSAVAEYLER